MLEKYISMYVYEKGKNLNESRINKYIYFFV